MGVYLNPGNEAFAQITASEYVDKTGLIGLVNRSIGTTKNLICISRARRFGKSYAAQMLCAYYDQTCDSRKLFEDYEIAGDETFGKYLNGFDVVYLDMTNILANAGPERMSAFIRENITNELTEAYPTLKTGMTLDQTMIHSVEQNKRRFVMIIDEWDAPIRENPEIRQEYLAFLRSLFKSSGTTARIFAAAYMTGILPIRKDGSQSAISDFEEFTMINPREYGTYVGLTEKEVRRLCREHRISFDRMKQWYDGYTVKNVGSVYNPNSVMKAIRYQEFDSYWTETSAAEGLMEYISKGLNGLTRTVAELIAGIRVSVDTNGFANDLTTFKGKDDVLTLLIHLGYLAYDTFSRSAYIPNEEIKREFQRAIRSVRHEETLKRLEESEQLFLDTICGNEEAVAEQIEKIHEEETSPLHYHREDSLRSVIKLAYYTYRDHYVQWEELPAGAGYADLVYLPKQDSGWPALLVELKWNQSAESAMDQIRRKRYPDALKGIGSEIILVGISYDKDAAAGERKHRCVIQKLGLPETENTGLREEGAVFRRGNERRSREVVRRMAASALREKGEMSMNELASRLGYAKLTNTLREVVHEMIRSGEAQLLYPDKPRCRNQRIKMGQMN